MENKYNETISKIEVSSEFKNKIIVEMEKEQAKRQGFRMKIRKGISAIASALGIMACGGVVFAAASGLIKFGQGGIIFSDKYYEYEQKVEQSIEKDGTTVSLVSSMCDDGFLVLQFEVDFNEELTKDEYLVQGELSFNQPLIEENGYKYLNDSASRDIIIDGKQYWLKSGTDSQVIENVKNKNYTIYKLYFLPSDIVERETFTVTLDNVIVTINSDDSKFLEMDGKFEIEVSKEKAVANTTTIKNENASVKYERLTNKIEKVSQTPMQTVIKLSSTITDITTRNAVEPKYLIYKVYDQDDNELFVFNVTTETEYHWEDGRVETFINDGAGITEWGFNKTIDTEYIVTEKNSNIKALRVEVFQKDENAGTTRNIGIHVINLRKERITCENKNEIVHQEYKEQVDPNLGLIKIDEVEYFDIEINEKYDYDIHRNYVEQLYNPEQWVLEEMNNGQPIVEYKFSFWNPEYMNHDFTVIVITNTINSKDVYYNPYKDAFIGENHETIVIGENYECKVILYMQYEIGKIEAIREIVDTIELKHNWDEEMFRKYNSKIIFGVYTPSYEIIECNYGEKLGKYTKLITFNMSSIKGYLYPNNDNGLEKNLPILKERLLQEREQTGVNKAEELCVNLYGFSIINGNNESKEAYKNNARAKKIKVTINNETQYIFELEDTNKIQAFDLNYKNIDIGRPIKVEIEVLEKYEGLTSNDAYIEEINFGLEGNGFGGI